MSKPRLSIVIFLLLCCLTFPIPKSEAKHLIIVYDISKSMYRLKNRTFMTASDLKRVNDYLTAMLFAEIPRYPKQASDAIIKPYDGEPFYQAGDLLSLFQFATEIKYKLQKRPAITSQDFKKLLPNPMNLRASFYGMDTFLGEAKVEIYTKLYQEGEETYWILVSDEDEDISIARQKNPEVKRKLAKIHEDYYEAQVFEILVNQHVTIRVHKITPRAKEETITQDTTTTDKIYVAFANTPNKPVDGIRFAKDKGGQKYISPKLVVSSEAPNKSDFILASLGVRVLSKNGAEFYTTRIPLDLKHIGDEFTIELPAHVKTLKRRGNQMELTVQYERDGAPKDLPPAVTNYLLRDGVPTWPFWVMLLVAVGFGCYLGGKWFFAQFIRGGSGTTIDIVLSRASSSGAIRENGKGFSLQEGDAVYFDRAAGPDSHSRTILSDS